MKDSVAVLGRKDGLYTKMVIHELDKYGIPSIFISTKNLSKVKKAWYDPLNFLGILKVGRYKAVGALHWFHIFLLFEQFKHRRNSYRKKIRQKYSSVARNPDLVVSDINSGDVVSYVRTRKCHLILIADVGIVSDDVIRASVSGGLNAHPALLPDCRGGGALEFTLYKDLDPGVTVHRVTSEIDGGSILHRKKLQLSFDDSFLSVTEKLTEQCAKELVFVADLILQGREFTEEENTGELNYWRDCNIEVQKKARANLRKRCLRINEERTL